MKSFGRLHLLKYLNWRLKFPDGDEKAISNIQSNLSDANRLNIVDNMKFRHNQKNGRRHGSVIVQAKLVILFCLTLVAEALGDEPKLTENLEPAPGGVHNAWSYQNQNSWGRGYPICEGAKMRQSPINICTASTILQPHMRLEFVDYDQEVEFQVKNTHHSVSLTPTTKLTQPAVRLNWLDEADSEFELQEIHFHWGDGDHKGSEHQIDGQSGAAEVSRG